MKTYKCRLRKSATKSCQHVKIHCSLFLYIKNGVNSEWSFISKNLNVFFQTRPKNLFGFRIVGIMKTNEDFLSS